MPFVLTAEQHPPRSAPDRIGGAVGRLNGAVPTLVCFERTGNEHLQGVLAEAPQAVDAVLLLARLGGWRVGVGAGPLHSPDGPRVAGPAVLAARRAVDAARQRPARLAVRGTSTGDAIDAQAVLGALAALIARRSAPAWEAVELVAAGRTQAQAAAALGISRQAVGQRLAAGLWELEGDLRPTAARLLARAAG